MASRTSSVSEKGQVTIPVELREQFHIATRERLRIELDEGAILVRPQQSPVDALYGSIKPLMRGLTVEEMISVAREEAAVAIAREGLAPAELDE